MGVSVQQYRASVGMFAGGRAPAPPWSGGSGRSMCRSWWWWDVFTMTMYFLLQVILFFNKSEQNATDILVLQSLSSQDMWEGCYAGIGCF